MQLIYDNIEGSGELYLAIMKAICGDVSDKNVCDLMCHHSPYIPQLGFKERTYVDVQDRPLDNKEERQFFIQSDVVDFLRKGNFYDFIICSDGIEHLPLLKARVMISLMERYAEKQIIFTPLGSYMVTKDEHPDSHQSGWQPEYFDGWASIVLKNFHPSLGMGAFFVWSCSNIQQDFKRVKKELSL